MTQDPLSGTFTALVTPMNRDGSLDLGALDVLVDTQIAAGISGLVPCGTTGEAVTLSSNERDTVLSRVVQRANGRVPVIAGTGSNSTAVTIENQRRAQELGATHGLVVTPYYNKPTPDGLLRHYGVVAETVSLPIVIYNVPGRTGCDIKPDTIAALAKVPGIVGVKEATADLDRVSALRNLTTPRFAVLSGDDGSAFPFITMGGDGVISVASNVLPDSMCSLVSEALLGHVQAARRVHDALRPLFAALFIESNPIPVKAAMAMQGRLTEAYRLPLCEMRPQNRVRLEQVMRAGGWV